MRGKRNHRCRKFRRFSKQTLKYGTKIADVRTTFAAKSELAAILGLLLRASD